MKILERAKKPLSRGQICIKLNHKTESQKSKISLLLYKLLKSREIKCIEIDRYQAMGLYHCKHRMKLYYISK